MRKLGNAEDVAADGGEAFARDLHRVRGKAQAPRRPFDGFTTGIEEPEVIEKILTPLGSAPQSRARRVDTFQRGGVARAEGVILAVLRR